MAVNPPPRRRISEQETRRRVLDQAGDRLVEQGLSVGLDAIRMEQVIADAGVSRASAYRCWPHRTDFLADVLVHAISRTSLIPEDDETIARLLGALEARREVLDTEQGRRDVVVEALRVSLDADIRRMLASPKWRLFMALSVTHQTLPDEGLRATVAGSLDEMEHALAQRRAGVYEAMAAMIGYRQRPPWIGAEGFMALSQLSGLAMRGVLSRALGDPSWLDERTELTLFGASEPAPWSQPEIAMTTVLLGHLEPDPSIDWTPERIAASEERFAEIAASLGGATTEDDDGAPPAKGPDDPGGRHLGHDRGEPPDRRPSSAREND
ncbi:TetR/AcrR family transcriptional regulator [Propionibacterium australiense]|uniref:DNA-binding HTH domain, TetR-type n=1 Tax=Propionibacterium australiense TaxID=119981 RepID=A0A383S986_9ACTN|nr:TetR/AcrR family transcriptional regulator [Propionibacterium australiense]RLP09507.1 TetR/AcrR family transcriptional regulator [Propionibacterium australiense]RLP09914.1 TetR/AcrR family transcriptional regulator [Propionibacterium australiense]SYZ33826.1 DNA-binding HTH domain, TetR-type [Propionibacterium australiense]VEH91969.1 Uncharacterised protein [Propionibacterium australiense]